MTAVRPLRAFVLPTGVSVLLALLTLLVWRQQVAFHRSLLVRHSEDVCMQASRRLQVFVESHLRAASIFARRWSGHEGRDFSHKRFNEFAAVIVSELPGFHAFGLMPPDLSDGWAVPEGSPVIHAIREPAGRALLEGARLAATPILSAPLVHGDEVHFHAALALQREAELLGYLVVDFRAETLVDDCFHERIRSEFNITIEDGDEPLFRFAPEPVTGAGSKRVEASISFPVANRTWRLTTVPRRQRAAWGGSVDLLVPIFGLVLSIGLGWLVYLLIRRMELYRAARDQDLSHQRRAMQRHAMLSRKVLVAQEEERSRLSRELHDEVGQLLTALRLEMGWWQKRLAEQSAEEASLFQNVTTLVEKGTDELRRICRGLRPPLLDDLGIEPAAQLLVREFAERTGIEAQLDCELGGEQCVSKEVALCIYRVLQESLNNVSRHAAARHVRVRLMAAGDDIELTVEDDGVGFDPGTLGGQQGCGLEGMRERAYLVGGTIELSSKHNRGACVLLRAPSLSFAPGGAAASPASVEEST